jgi:hypothetical protein
MSVLRLVSQWAALSSFSRCASRTRLRRLRCLTRKHRGLPPSHRDGFQSHSNWLSRRGEGSGLHPRSCEVHHAGGAGGAAPPGTRTPSSSPHPSSHPWPLASQPPARPGSHRCWPQQQSGPNCHPSSYPEESIGRHALGHWEARPFQQSRRDH